MGYSQHSLYKLITSAFTFVLVFLLSVSNTINAQTTCTDTEETFSFTGAVQNWMVPNGVTEITITAAGAQGGAGNNSVGGQGATVQGTFTVTPGTNLSIYVGGQGGAGTNGGGGGGGSFVVDGTNLLVAAGGGSGGAGNSNGRDGLDTNDGEAGAGNSNTRGEGGIAGGGGGGGAIINGGGGGGGFGGGTGGAGGPNSNGMGGDGGNDGGGGGGAGGFNANGSDGTGGVGGAGGSNNAGSGGSGFSGGFAGGSGGGNGGDGGFGGGGGGSNNSGAGGGYSGGGGTGQGAGGGGGSFVAPSASSPTLIAGGATTNTGNGNITICYVAPAVIPTMSEWALILMGFVLMTLFAAVVTVPKLATQGMSGFRFQYFPFDATTYATSWVQVAFAITLLFAIAIQFFGYGWTSADPIGATLCSFVAAYWVFLIKRTS